MHKNEYGWPDRSYGRFNINPLDAWEGAIIGGGNIQSFAFSEMQRIREGRLVNPRHPQLEMNNNIIYWQNQQKEGFEIVQNARHSLEITKNWNLPRWSGLEGHMLRHYVSNAVDCIKNKQEVKFNHDITASSIPVSFIDAIQLCIKQCCKEYNDPLKEVKK